MTERELPIKIVYTIAPSQQALVARHRRIPVKVLFSDGTTGTSRNLGYANLPLKTCLQAICSASPELFADASRDYTVYALDPAETTLTHISLMPLPNAAKQANPRRGPVPNGVAVGMGFMSWCLSEEDAAEDPDGKTVLGRVTHHPLTGELVEVIFALQATQKRAFVPPQDHVRAWAMPTASLGVVAVPTSQPSFYYPPAQPHAMSTPAASTTSAAPPLRARTRSLSRKPTGSTPKDTPPPGTPVDVIDLTGEPPAPKPAPKPKRKAPIPQKPNLTTVPVQPPPPPAATQNTRGASLRRSNTVPANLPRTPAPLTETPAPTARSATMPGLQLGPALQMDQIMAVAAKLRDDPSGQGLDPVMVSALREAFPQLFPPATEHVATSSEYEEGTSSTLVSPSSIPVDPALLPEDDVPCLAESKRKRRLSESEHSDSGQPRKRHNTSDTPERPEGDDVTSGAISFAAPPTTPSRGPNIAALLASGSSLSPSRLFRTPSGGKGGPDNANVTLSAMLRMITSSAGGGSSGLLPAFDMQGINSSPLRFMNSSPSKQNVDVEMDIFNSSPFRAFLSSPTRQSPMRRRGSTGNAGNDLRGFGVLPPSSPLPPQTSSPTQELSALPAENDEEDGDDGEALDATPADQTIEFSVEAMMQGNLAPLADGGDGADLAQLGNMWELFAPLLRANGMLDEGSAEPSEPTADDVEQVSALVDGHLV